MVWIVTECRPPHHLGNPANWIFNIPLIVHQCPRLISYIQVSVFLTTRPFQLFFFFAKTKHQQENASEWKVLSAHTVVLKKSLISVHQTPLPLYKNCIMCFWCHVCSLAHGSDTDTVLYVIYKPLHCKCQWIFPWPLSHVLLVLFHQILLILKLSFVFDSLKDLFNFLILFFTI